jgi:hypothetical protein
VEYGGRMIRTMKYYSGLEVGRIKKMPTKRNVSLRVNDNRKEDEL